MYVDDASMVAHARSAGVSSFVAVPHFGQVRFIGSEGVSGGGLDRRNHRGGEEGGWFNRNRSQQRAGQL